jgi:sulfite reductase (NADPH) flavoprotein alpha-component
MQSTSADVVEPIAPASAREPAPELRSESAPASTQAPLPGLSLRRLTQAVRGFSSEQLLWSSGYLAGLAAARASPRWEQDFGPVPAQAEAGTAQPARLTILYASQTGNARGLAEALGRQAEARQLSHRVVSVADYQPRDLKRERLVVFVVSTQGEGEPPESAQGLYRFLNGKGAPRLADLDYGVFGLGDSSYEHFCQAARDLDRRLAELGARRLLERVDADLDYQPIYAGWSPAALDRVAAELEPRPVGGGQVRDAEIVPLRAHTQARHDRVHPYRARVLDNRPLTTPDAVAEVRHLVLGMDSRALAYAPGDSIGVRFRNDPALVTQVLAATGLDGESAVTLDEESLALADVLATRLELTRLHPSVVCAWTGLQGDPALGALVGDGEALRGYCRQHQVIDLVTQYPARPQAQQLAGLLQPIQPRLYSIASAPAEYDDEVHLAVSVLRYRVKGQDRLGGASGFLAERLAEGDPLDCYVAENPSFRLPIDGDTPLILVGAGTGIAPFRAFLQQRAARGDRGCTWLIFGNRHFRRDFLYQADWLRLRKAGVLHRFSPAFSRDSSERIYVQDRLRAEGAELWRWLAEGARIYCCGCPAMETAVRETLAAVARDQGALSGNAALEFVEDLRRDGRYLRDTY